MTRSRSSTSIAWVVTFVLALGTAVGARPADATTISLTAHDRPIGQVLALIGDRFDLSIVSQSAFPQNVSVTLRGLGVDDALRAVLSTVGASFRRDGRLVTIVTGTRGTARGPVAETPAPAKPVAVTVAAIPVERAAAIVRRFYPKARIEADASARTLIVDALPADTDAIRAMLQTLDVPDPAKPTVEALTLANASPAALVAQLRPLFPASRFSAGPNRTLIVEARPVDQSQIKTLVASIDIAPVHRPGIAVTTVAVPVVQMRASDVARALATGDRALHASVAGDTVILSGPADHVARARALIAQIDVPGATARYSSIYRVRFVDPKAAAALVARTFPDAATTVDTELGVISVVASASEHARIARAIAQVDDTNATTTAPAPQTGAAANAPERPITANAAGATYLVDVVNLRAAIPNAAAGTPSTTTADVAATVLATLSNVAPDLRLTAVPNQPQLIVSGTPYAVRLAKDLIARIDQPQKLVILDTQILEVNDTVAKNLGLSFAPNAGLTTAYSETTPQPNAAGNAIPLLGLQPLSRTPLSLQFQLGLAISQGKARILADPRITTLSGKTASIRAGDNLTVLTQTGGGTGVAVTTQLQTFNTGVSLDITPIVNDQNYVTINLHPVVNNVSSISSAGIPQISTRDTQTTIGIREGQTVVIGGLLQDSSTRTTTKIPILGDLPLIGQAFRNEQLTSSRDELIITITPHIVDPMQEGSLIPLPPPAPIPTTTPQPRRGLPGATFPPLPGSAAATASQGPIALYGTVPSTYSLSSVPTAAPSPAAATNGRTGSRPPAAQASPGTFSGIPGLPPGALGPLPFPGTPLTGPQSSSSAFAGTNVFTFGTAPANNYAGPSDPAQIFFATFGPTVLRDGTPVNVSAVTTSNVTKVTVGFGSATATLASAGLGKWQAAYAFSTAGLSANQTSVQLTMTATRADGGTTSISIPVNIAQ